MKLKKLNLIKSIILLQVFTGCLMFGVYYFAIYKQHTLSAKRLVELRAKDIHSFIMPLYDDIVSSHLLGLDEKYKTVTDRLVKEKIFSAFLFLRKARKGRRTGLGIFTYYLPKGI